MDKIEHEKEIEELKDAVTDACRSALEKLDFQRLLAESEETGDSIKLAITVTARPRHHVEARVTGFIKVVGEGVAQLEDPDQMRLDI